MVSFLLTAKCCFAKFFSFMWRQRACTHEGFLLNSGEDEDDEANEETRTAFIRINV